MLHKATFQYEVIYDDAEVPHIHECDMGEIHHLAIHGPCSGQMIDVDDQKLSKEEAYTAIENQGTDPSFFNLSQCEKCWKVISLNEVETNEDGPAISLCSDCVENK